MAAVYETRYLLYLSSLLISHRWHLDWGVFPEGLSFGDGSRFGVLLDGAVFSHRRTLDVGDEVGDIFRIFI